MKKDLTKRINNKELPITIDDIVKEIATTNTFYNDLIVRYFNKEKRSLVISELAVNFLKDRKKMNTIIKNGNIKGYFVRSIFYWSTKGNLIHILNSRDRISRESTNIDIIWNIQDRANDTLFEDTLEILDETQVSLRDALIFKLVFKECLTYRDIQDTYGFSTATVSRSIRSSIEKIRVKIGKVA